MRHLPLFMIAMALAGAARAEPTLECPGSSQIEIGACVTEALRAVDQAVDSVLGFARAAAQDMDDTTGRAETLPALEAAQAAWSAWRDAQCTYVGATYAGGSGSGIAVTACRVT